MAEHRGWRDRRRRCHRRWLLFRKRQSKDESDFDESIDGDFEAFGGTRAARSPDEGASRSGSAVRSRRSYKQTREKNSASSGVLASDEGEPRGDAGELFAANDLGARQSLGEERANRRN